VKFLPEHGGFSGAGRRLFLTATAVRAPLIGCAPPDACDSSQSQLHVGRRELHLVAANVEQDPGEDLHTAGDRDGVGYVDVVRQVVPLTVIWVLTRMHVEYHGVRTNPPPDG
jgi:hypothetical protein